MEGSASRRYLGWRAWAGGWAGWEHAAPFLGMRLGMAGGDNPSAGRQPALGGDDPPGGGLRAGWVVPGAGGLAFAPSALLCHLPPFFPSLWIFLVASWAGSAAPGLTRRPHLVPPALTQLRRSFYFRGF